MVFWAIVVVLPQGTPNFSKFLHLAPENSDFAIFNNFYFLNNFLLKCQNKISRLFWDNP